MNIEIGDKVKTKLSQPAIMCSARKQVECFKWWIVIDKEAGDLILEDKDGNIMITDKDGNGIDEFQDHKIYKINK